MNISKSVHVDFSEVLIVLLQNNFKMSLKYRPTLNSTILKIDLRPNKNPYNCTPSFFPSFLYSCLFLCLFFHFFLSLLRQRQIKQVMIRLLINLRSITFESCFNIVLVHDKKYVVLLILTRSITFYDVKSNIHICIRKHSVIKCIIKIHLLLLEKTSCFTISYDGQLHRTLAR